MMVWRARSASDKTEDWPYWYVTKDVPKDYNDTKEAIEVLTGNIFYGLPFLTKNHAVEIAEKMNEETK